MSLTVNPVVLFNASTGSDTLASGAGPATAVNGTAANVTSASTSATITDAVALGGVATDGSAVLWVQTASGRQYSRISAISGSSGAWTLTLEDSVWTTSTNKNWAIGGLRATFNDAGSRTLFAADAKGGWTIQTQTDQSGITTEIACTAAGSAATGYITLQGDSVTTRRLLTTATNNTSLLAGSFNYWKILNLNFQSTAGTKTTTYGLDMNAASTLPLWIQNCSFGDPTNKLQHAVFRNTASQPIPLRVIDCEVQYCLGYGLDNGGGGGGTFEMRGCKVHHNGATAGVLLQFGAAGIAAVTDCEIHDNTGVGISLTGGVSNASVPSIQRCTIHNNTLDGVKVDTALNFTGFTCFNNNITGNGGYGINYTGANGDVIKGLCDFNNFGFGAGIANTSGPVNGLSLGAHDLQVDPGYASAATGNFATGTNVRAKGFPDSTRVVGGNPATGTTVFVDIGAQHQDSPATYVINKQTTIYLPSEAD